MKIYIPPQITRLGIYFIIFISLYLFIKQRLVPESFGKYGHYRADYLDENASLDAVYGGQQLCFECHEDIFDLRNAGLHKGLSCETCHGPALLHAESFGEVKPDIPAGREFCGRCHSQNAARSANIIAQVDITEHNKEFDCMECHNSHQPWAELK